MKREEIEREFEEIAKKSQPLFNQPVTVSKASSPLGTYIKPKIGEKPILPEFDINIDIISKVTRLLIVHDQLREEIYKYQQEKGYICPSLIIPELRDLSDIEDFKHLLDRLNKLLKDVYSSPESERRGCIERYEIENYNKKHPPIETFFINFNHILQDIHTLSLEILQEYNMIALQYTSKTGIDETKILIFSIGAVRIINIEPYSIPKPIIDFINAFNDEAISSELATYMNVLYIKTDNKYRMDLTLGAAFDHRSLIVYDPDPSIETFDHTYIDGNYSRTLAWKKYLSDFSVHAEKAQIYILNNKLSIEKRKDITKSVSESGKEKELEKGLAWRDSLYKTKVPKENLIDMVMIIYLINWDGVVNHSTRIDIMSVEDEANIIYYYGLYALYNEQKKRYVPRYNIEMQKTIRSAIRDTVGGIEKVLKVLLPGE